MASAIYLFIFLLNLIIIVIKKVFEPMGSTQPMWVSLGWVGLNFFNLSGGLSQKISSTRPMHTPNCHMALKLDYYFNSSI